MRNDYAEINLSNIRHNIGVIRAGLSASTRYLAVVKANAYGHGMEQVAAAALGAGASYLAVAITEEGERLRNAGFTAPILLLGGADEAHLDTVVQRELTPAVFTCEGLLALQRHAAANSRTCRFHFKIDTGMNRIGMREEAEFVRALELLGDCPNLVFEGMFTHFAVSELVESDFTARQAARFSAFAALAHARGFRPLLHASNSAASLRLPDYQFDMVRGGIAMYGYHPSGRPDAHVDLRPALSWKTAVVHLKTIQPGESVSYGLRFTAERPTVVATLPVGYGDGYKRCLTNRACVLIRGRRAPQIGTICMDQMMCDVTELPEVCVGDEAVLIGAQGNEAITADEMADWAHTISYEILLSISERVPRVFIE